MTGDGHSHFYGFLKYSFSKFKIIFIILVSRNDQKILCF